MRRVETCSLSTEAPLDWGTLHLGVVYATERSLQNHVPFCSDAGREKPQSSTAKQI